MTICTTKKEVLLALKPYKLQGAKTGFVPTMGALHQGHASLITQSATENDVTIVSIFVNPTQFNNAADLTNYPRTIEADIALLKSLNKNIILFTPTPEVLYSNNVSSKTYTFDGLEHEMEGKHRPGHFNGVGTIIDLFFTLLQPTNAYFGEKDYQQLRIIQKLTEKYNFSTHIIGCPIFREPSGLAMSSRNKRLSDTAKNDAVFIIKTLESAKKMAETMSFLTIEQWITEQFKQHPTLSLEYVSIANSNTLKTETKRAVNQKYRIFVAAFIDNIRLIDNIALN